MKNERIREKAYAKINLGLDVLKRRPDGYHEVRMVMQTIDLYDEITVWKTQGEELLLTCDMAGLPLDQRNLAYRAAALLREVFSVGGGLRIDIKKRIPAAAGMAGGSSDAAAVLRAVNRLYGLGLDNAQLATYGVRLGADVPYCVYGGTMLAEGIGEKLTALAPAPACGVLVAKPDTDVSTKFVYENLHADKLEVHPDIDGLMKALAAQDISAAAGKLSNVLETVTVPAYPVIGSLKEMMKEQGALNALMSGSGPTVFGLFFNKADGQAAYEAVGKSGLAKDMYLTEQCTP